MGMILTWDEAMVERALRRRYGETVVFTNGVFDLLHVGHLDYLEQAFEERDQNMPYISVDPIFDPFRDDPRFLALLEGLGLPR